MSDNSRLVYSTEFGKIKEDKPQETFDGDGIVRIQRETKGRKGKGVCVISGINPLENNLKDICKKLKQACGCGGSVKGQQIEIQGDNREKIKSVLEGMSFKVKFAGG